MPAAPELAHGGSAIAWPNSERDRKGKAVAGWKVLALNAAVTLLLVFAGVRMLLPGESMDREATGQMLASAVKPLEDRLAGLEARIPSGRPDPAPASPGPSGWESRTDDLIRKMNAIESRLAALEAKEPRPGLRNMPPAAPSSPPMPEGGKSRGELGKARGGPFGWIQDLPEEKQETVREIFKEHGQRLRKRLAQKSGEGPPDPSLMREVMEEGQQELDEELKVVLSPEEYQRYLDSRPNLGPGPRPGTPPGARGKRQSP